MTPSLDRQILDQVMKLTTDVSEVKEIAKQNTKDIKGVKEDIEAVKVAAKPTADFVQTCTVGRKILIRGLWAVGTIGGAIGVAWKIITDW